MNPFRSRSASLERWRKIGERGRRGRQAWIERTRRLNSAPRSPFHDALNRNLALRIRRGDGAATRSLRCRTPNIATRQASQLVINAIAEVLPNLLGGSADLTHSNLTQAKTQRPVRQDSFEGSYIHYGVREHAMAAAMNGIALHGGFIPYGGTFLSFADYSRPAIRLAALMGIRVIHVMTHDFIGLGEDGPTHQPVEHLAALRAIPNLLVFRPGDAVETAEAWDCALRARPPFGAMPVPASACHVPGSDRRGKSGRARRLRGRRAGGRPRRHPDRDRLRSRRSRLRPQNYSPRTASRLRSSRPPASSCSAGSRRNTGQKCWAARRALVSRPRSRATGRAGSAMAANSSG